jgi:hypothetical protein
MQSDKYRMKSLLLASILLASSAGAQVIECPKFYPWQDTPMTEVPFRHTGKGFVAKAKLSGAGMFTGEANGQEELIGDRTKVKNGWDVQHGFAGGEAKWLVCSYGSGEITWWEQIGSRVTSCKIEARKAGRDPMSVKATCK